MSTTTALLLVLLVGCSSFQPSPLRHTRRISTRINLIDDWSDVHDGGRSVGSISRRRAFEIVPLILATTTHVGTANAAQNTVPNLDFKTSSSGLQYADVKTGTGSTSPQIGESVSIDYVMSTTGARYGSKIYSTQDAGAPYRWKLGDGSTIPGLEEAVMGMSPGGIRRVVIPSKLAYQSGSGRIQDECAEGKGLGPIPPPQPESIGEFQRFKNIYCNPDRQYYPDVVLDVKLYGKR